MAYLLAIDLGTSGPKVAVTTDQGELISSAFAPVDLMLLPGGGAEQAPEQWWAAVVQATRQALDASQVPAEQVIAIGCTAQWSGTVAVGFDGHALGNALIWMDSRGAAAIEQLISGPVRVAGYEPIKLAQWIRYTGGAPTKAGKDPLAHILYLKMYQPARYQQTKVFLEPKDYLNYRLTGRAVATYDSITLHWLTDNRQIDRVQYAPALLALTGIDPQKLPPLIRAVDIVGPLRPEVAAELGLSPQTVVIGGTPDVPSAAIGSGAVDDYACHVYIGTSAWIGCHVPWKKTDLIHNMASLPSPLPGRYLMTNEQESAGACLTFLRDQLVYPDDPLALGPRPDHVYRRFDQVVAGVLPGSGGVIFTPWLYGERTPIEDHSVRAGFFNLSLHTTRAQMVRAVFEGVAYNTRWLFQTVEQFLGRKVPKLHFIGGGAQSRVWQEILANVLQRPIYQVADPLNANARGVAYLTSLALGRMRLSQIASRTQFGEVVEPDPAQARLYHELFTTFLQIYRQNRAIYARLNRGAALPSEKIG